jgi:hypothetical protein
MKNDLLPISCDPHVFAYGPGLQIHCYVLQRVSTFLLIFSIVLHCGILQMYIVWVNRSTVSNTELFYDLLL